MHSKTYVKSLKTSPKTATIVLDTAFGNGQLYAKAVYALLGGYNEVARNVDTEEYRKLKEDFHGIIESMAVYMAHSPEAK